MPHLACRSIREKVAFASKFLRQLFIEDSHVYRIPAAEDLLKHVTEVAIYSVSAAYPSDKSHLGWNAVVAATRPRLSALSAMY
eukprot:CAMPEP_0115546858 /NCGR_PEP_ID=MMETSP0271-20121206/93345_1 /TAXON_ID=71861 /ORGANISM="Scrippsiella trochoidea, Strain CCMP3099" /LENGTH=82 /DNA_ID=CAMNT_0002980267 /DNA_START=60 /DNA_END=308 /DNA_ORIENTATION=-